LLKYCFDIKWKCSTFVQRWSNHFFGGLFKHVTAISLFGERPFEHECFVRTAESFPSSEKLCLVEEKPQMNNNLHFLILFGLFFLKLMKITLNNFYLIHHRLYHMVSRFLSTNFTRDATRINGSNVNFPYYKSTQRIAKHFKSYFLCKQRMRLWHLFK